MKIMCTSNDFELLELKKYEIKNNSKVNCKID